MDEVTSTASFTVVLACVKANFEGVFIFIVGVVTFAGPVFDSSYGICVHFNCGFICLAVEYK